MNIYILLTFTISILSIYYFSKFYKKYYFNPNKLTVILNDSSTSENFDLYKSFDHSKYQVIINNSNPQKYVNFLNKKGIEAYGINTDFSFARNIENGISYILYYFGKVDILVNYYDNLPNKLYFTDVMSYIFNISFFTEKISKKLSSDGKVVNILSKNFMSNNKYNSNLLPVVYIENLTKLLSIKYNEICITTIKDTNYRLVDNIKLILNSRNNLYSGRVISPHLQIYSNLELNINEEYLNNKSKSTLKEIGDQDFYTPIGENFIGHSPKINNINLNNYNFSKYPKKSKLKIEISKKYKIPIDSISINNGITNTMNFIIKTFVKDNHQVITTSPSWELYDDLLNKYNKINVKSKLVIKSNNLQINFDDILNKITPLTRLIILISPINKNEFEDFCKKLPSNIVIAIDNCYDEFTLNSYKTNPAETYKYKNIIINLYSFSKFYGLGNLGIGFSISSIQINKVLEHTISYNISNLYEDIASIALSDNKHNSLIRDSYLSERRYIINRVTSNNIDYIDWNQSFILIKYDHSKLQQKLKNIRISNANPLQELPDYIPFYIDTRDINKKMLDAIL